MPEGVRQHAERAQRRVHGSTGFRLDERGRVRWQGRVSVPLCPWIKTFRKSARKSRFSFVGGSENGLILKFSDSRPTRTYGSAEELRQAFEASAQIEDEGVRSVFLQIGDEEIQKKRFPGARSPENHGVGHIAVMKIQEVRRVMVGFENGEIFLPEMRVARLAAVQGKEKREIGIVGVEQIQGTQIEGVVARNRGEKRIQKVVFFFIELRIMDAEHLVKIRARAVHFGQVQVIDDDGQGKLAKVIPVQLDFLDPFAEFADLRFLGIVEEHVLCWRIVQIDLAGERPLGVVKVAALGLNDPAHLAGIFLFPLGHDVIVRFHFEQPFKDEWKALRGRFFERQDFDVVVVDAEMAAVAFERGFREVVVEKGVVLELGELRVCQDGS